MRKNINVYLLSSLLCVSVAWAGSKTAFALDDAGSMEAPVRHSLGAAAAGATAASGEAETPQTRLSTLIGRYTQIMKTSQQDPTRSELLSIRDEFCKIATDYSLPEAMFFYAKMCHRGIGGSTNTKEALSFYQQAGKLGHGAAWFECGKMYGSMPSVSLSINTINEYNAAARNCFKNAADLGKNSESACLYAYMCQNGAFGPKNMEDARTYYEIAARDDFNCAPAFFSLGLMYKKGWDGGNVDPLKARTLFETAAALDHPLAQHHLALMCLAQGDDVNRKRAHSYLQKLADQGCRDSQYTLAQMCLDQGEYMNREKALTLLETAADEGHLQAKYDIAMMFLAQSDDLNKMKALTLLETAAARGHLQAKYDIAMMCLAQGDDLNKMKAHCSLQELAAEGHAKAQESLVENFK